MSSLPVHLPAGFTPLVSVGDIVHIGQPLAMKGEAVSTAVINIATELSVPVSRAGKAVKKNPGDSVSPGDVLASRSGFLGMGEQKVVSSITGSVLSYERRTGELTLKVVTDEGSDTETYPAPVAGKISMCDNGKIVIDRDEEIAISPALGIGGSVTGEIQYLTHDEDSAIPLHLLSQDLSGKIVVGKSFDREGLTKMLALDVVGVVTVRIKEADLAYLTRKRSFPLITVREEEFAEIAKHTGKTITLDGEKKKVVL